VESSRFERVIRNFLQNAIKYSPPASAIQVRHEVKDDRAMVSVIDAGPGIAAEDRSYVFEKYKRTTSAKSKEGLGLGLYISRKIIEAHRGEIGVEDAPGGGAVFFVRLPRSSAEPRRGEAIPKPSPVERLRGLKVLLVDNEANAVSAPTMLLGEEGVEVVGATSGEAALALAATKRPDVAVIDVQMPGMTGLTLLGLLRERYPGLPAVITSGHMERHAGISAARASSGASYVGKPVDVDELLRALDRIAGASVALNA
jgi:two-component system CheB/CheR fusion protein